MHNETNDIEELFSKKFEKYEVKSSDQEWLDISAKLGKVNFLKFSFVTFNIYYLVVIVALAGTTTFEGIRNYQLAKKIHHLESSLESNKGEQQPEEVTKDIEDQKSESVFKSETDPQINANNKTNDQVEIKKNVIKSELKEKLDLDSKTQKNKQGTRQENINQNVDEVQGNSLKPIESVKKSDSLSQPSIRRVVKKTYVIKQKSVIVKDTVIVKKY